MVCKAFFAFSERQFFLFSARAQYFGQQMHVQGHGLVKLYKAIVQLNAVPVIRRLEGKGRAVVGSLRSEAPS